MPDESVEIKLRAVGEGFEQTKAKIQDLYRAAAAYTEKDSNNPGKGWDVLAKTARSDAMGLERDLARVASERAAAEKGLSAARRSRAALRAAAAPARR